MLTNPIPGPPVEALSAAMQIDPDSAPAPGDRHRGLFSAVNWPTLPSLIDEVIWVPGFLYLDVDLQVTGTLISNGWATQGVVTVTSAYIPQPGDAIILANASGGAFTVTLPDATQPGYVAGQRYTVIKTDSSANNVTVAATAGQLIGGASTVTLTTANAFTGVAFDGITTNNWWVWAQNASGSNPVGSAGGDLSGSYPGPTVANIGNSTLGALLQRTACV